MGQGVLNHELRRAGCCIGVQSGLRGHYDRCRLITAEGQSYHVASTVLDGFCLDNS